MRSLPLFHRIAGRPVIVLGEGPAAEAKRRLVERAGGEVVSEIGEGVGRGARLAFIAHDDAGMCAEDALRLRGLGLLVNVVDQPELCDFTMPSLLERDPVLIAIGTSGASAGLAKHVRLRLEALLPQSLGALASGLQAARERLRARWPSPADRRTALDAVLAEGGALDPLDDESAERIDAWLEGAADCGPDRTIEIALASDDPDDLTLRQARLLGMADTVLHDPAVPETILARARADAQLRPLPYPGAGARGLTLVLRRI